MSVNYMFNAKEPSWLHTKVAMNLFEDESKTLNLGLTEDTEYLEWGITAQYASSWT